MKLSHTIASINVDGKYFPIKNGNTTIGNLKINLVLENKADDFYLEPHEKV